MAAWFWIAFALVIVAIGIILAVSIYTTRTPDALEQLGVLPNYASIGLPVEKIDAYNAVKERIQKQYGSKGSDAEAIRQQLWMSQLPPDAKDSLKWHLMQRAIGDMTALQKIDVDARGYWRLFSKGMVTKEFWKSVVEAEKELSMELESVKSEAASVEPNQDPQGIISEAMQFVLRYGDKLPSASELAKGAEQINDLMKHLPGPPGMLGIPPPGMPGMGGMPGMPHPGMLPPGMPHPGMPPPGGPLPPGVQAPQKGNGPGIDETDLSNPDFTWRQDADTVEISVNVPKDARKNDVKVVFKSRSFKAQCRDEILLEGQLACPCDPEDSTWTLGGGLLVVTLQKPDPRAWQTLFAKK